jgi:hypothetical protein
MRGYRYGGNISLVKKQAIMNQRTMRFKVSKGPAIATPSLEPYGIDMIDTRAIDSAKRKKLARKMKIKRIYSDSHSSFKTHFSLALRLATIYH